MMDTPTSFWKRIRAFVRGYRGKYFDYIYYLHRYFNIKGLSSQGAFNLEQPEVYIDVTLSSENLDNSIAGVIPQANNGLSSKNPHHIWDYIDKKAMPGNKLVVIGSPGSGKTTILKQITLAFCKFRKKYSLPNRIPLLIFIRNHAPDIIGNPKIRLVEVLSDSLLKGGLECNQQWFERKLQRGQCVILFDGMDEIGESDFREDVMKWLEKQFALYPENHFIITSRPHGIINNGFKTAETVRILPFDANQIEEFIHDWYYAIEKRLSQADDPGVRMLGARGAQDLLSRIHNTDALQPLAQNALLLTMIATLHRFDAQLPGRRVELYDAIFRIFFRRRDLLGVAPLTSEQSKRVLEPLASYMMEKNKREISLEEAVDVITKDLEEISGESIQPSEFLLGVQEQSGLLLEVAENELSFASLTFQEYLASVHYFETQNVDKLVKEIRNDWWRETIRLYCAQSDGTKIIAACLADEPIQLEQLQLAIDCLEEALRVDVKIRKRLNNIIREGVDNPDPKWRNVIASALLFKRLRFMDRLDARRLIDNTLVSNVEYQIFLDQEAEKDQYYYPDHWIDNRFPTGTALDPIVGVRIDDVEEFFKWLVPKDIWRFQYRMPEEREITYFKCDTQTFQYWLNDGESIRTSEAKRDVHPRYKEFVIEQMLDDSTVFKSIRSAVERGKTARPAGELLARGRPVSGGSRSSLDLTSEIRAIEFRKGEMERFKEWNLMDNFRRFTKQLDFDFGAFLEGINIVSVKNKEHEQAFDWIPVFPYPPEYGFDIGKETAEFEKRYSETQLRAMLGRKLNNVIEIHTLVSKMILNRSWHQFANSSADLGETYNFIRLTARICLLTMAFGGKSNYPSFSRDVANIYLLYCLLERRIIGTEKPVEGIRLVKFS